MLARALLQLSRIPCWFCRRKAWWWRVWDWQSDAFESCGKLKDSSAPRLYLPSCSLALRNAHSPLWVAIELQGWS
jgi:hypothetical protein